MGVLAFVLVLALFAVVVVVVAVAVAVTLLCVFPCFALGNKQKAHNTTNNTSKTTPQGRALCSLCFLFVLYCFMSSSFVCFAPGLV